MLKHLTLVASSFALIGSAVAAPSTTGNFAGLALAALVAEHEPGLSLRDRRVMAWLLDGRNNFHFPAGHTIIVKADKIQCRASDVAIDQRSCDLTFGTATRHFTGRRANELYATMAEAGVASDGAAGSIFEALTALSCTIDPNVIRQNAGGGADCTYAAGP